MFNIGDRVVCIDDNYTANLGNCKIQYLVKGREYIIQDIIHNACECGDWVDVGTYFEGSINTECSVHSDIYYLNNINSKWWNGKRFVKIKEKTIHTVVDSNIKIPNFEELVN